MDTLFLDQGLPSYLQVDNASYFSSATFKEYCDKNTIEIIYSSPFNSRSAAMAERYNGIHKSMLKKSKSFGDFLCKLREFRNAPRSDSRLSPAQFFVSRAQRTNLPILPKNLIGQDFGRSEYQLRISKNEEKFDKIPGKRQKPMKIGDLVHVQDTISKLWNKKGRIIEVIDRCKHPKCNICDKKSKSYIIKLDGKKKVRNAKFLRLLKEKSDNSAFEDEQTDNSADQKGVKMGPLRPLSSSQFRHDSTIASDDQIAELEEAEESRTSTPASLRSCLKSATSMDPAYGTGRLRRSKRLKKVWWARPIESVHYFA